jgi:phage repressor protein C with HTH and peptisase S24 domain
MSDAAFRLRAARIKAGFPVAAEAARYIGVSAPTYSAHENGSRGITTSVAMKYARAFRIAPEWLLYGKAENEPAQNLPDSPRSESLDLVPIYDIEASAGNGVIPGESEDVTGQLVFPPGYLRHITSTPPRQLAIVTVQGDSMAPTLKPRDVVLIDTTKTNLGYDGLFVLRMDGAVHVKRVQRGARSGLLRILSDNKDAYPPYERDIGDVEAVGKVLWYGRKE